MIEGMLKVVYYIDDYNHDMENELIILLTKHGYKWSGQGTDLVREERDIGFIKELETTNENE